MSILTKLATAAVQRQNKRLIDAGFKAVRLMTAIRAENAHLKAKFALARKRGEELEADLGAARDRIRQLERDLAAERITVEDLRAQQRRAVEHLRVCELAQAVADHDLDKARSNAS